MKTMAFYCLSGLLFGMLAAEAARGEQGDVQGYYRRIDEASSRKDPRVMFAVLADLDTNELWSFGAGLGPTDGDSMQMSALQAFYGALCDDEGRPRFDDSTVAKMLPNTNAMHWARLFQSDPKDQQALLRMLDDRKPAIRWLGLKKATCLAQLDNPIYDRLHTIVDGDPYVQISRRSLQPDKKRPAPPGKTVNEFVCPLRELACELMNRRGHTCQVNQTAIAQMGVERLVRICDQDEKKQRSVLDAVTLLDPEGAGITALRQLGSKANTNATVKILLGATPESHE